jgi:hypothetical protein
MAKLDPRADPTSVPPSSKDDFSVDRVAVPKKSKRASIAEPQEPADGVESSVVQVREAEAKTSKNDERIELDDKLPVEKVEKAEKAETAEKPAKKVTSRDPRYEPLERLLDLNDWKKIGDELGPMSDVGKLPPNLGLLAALAHNETAKDGDPDAAATAIRCMAGLLGVDDDSPIARVLARRMLRKNPVKLTERQAPPARTSLLIVLVTLVLGGGVGWLASEGSWSAIAHTLHLR